MKFTNKLVLPVLALSLIASSAFAQNSDSKRSWAQEFVREDASYIKNGSIIAGVISGLFAATRQASAYKLDKIVDNTLYLKPFSALEIANAGIAGAVSGGLYAALLLSLAHFCVSESLAND